ncbi:phosphohistidine phosphatase SixA [Undibacterium arcticum]|uniref:Phosphohistidine phosphatase SixA n=1 Tax=Undibacterium arcticum TaxID=1762892 RepID=A0ABV7F430_9BURK
MELILWRHAEAEIGDPEGALDEGRRLTAKGHKQAARMAEWLAANLPERCKILVSPATRAVQTAEALGRKFKIHPDLGPMAGVVQILTAANWPHAKEPVLIVGHQPTLGQIAAALVAGVEQNWSIRKGNVWWIAQKDRGDDTSNYLRAVMAPELIKK